MFFFYRFQLAKVNNKTWLLNVTNENKWFFIIGYQESTVSRSKREIGERKSAGKASLLSGKNKMLVGFLLDIVIFKKRYICLICL